MADDANCLTIAGLNAYWRDALARAIEDVDEQVASTAMLLTAVQHKRSGMGSEKAAAFLAMLSRAVGDGEMVSIAVGDVTLHLKDAGQARQ